MRWPLPALALAAMTSLAAAAQPSSPVTLAQLQDRYRPLLVFAARPDDPSLLTQLARLKDHAPGLEERQVLVIALPFNSPSPAGVSLADSDARQARRRFHVDPSEFTAILLGKDGEEKLRSKKPVSFQQLSHLIDAMPMRRQEMGDSRRR